MDSELFAQLSGSLQPVEGFTFIPQQWLDVDSLRYEDLLFGYFLGLLDVRSLLEIESERSQRGQLQDARERHLVSMVADDPAAIVRQLSQTPADAIFEDRQARRIWLRILLRLMVQVWDSGVGDPQLDLVEALDAWGEEGRSIWNAIQPRGMDSLVFGLGARRRLVDRTRAYIDSDLSEV